MYCVLLESSATVAERVEEQMPILTADIADRRERKVLRLPGHRAYSMYK